MTLGALARRALLATVLLPAWPALAGNLSYMNDTPYTHFTKEDHKVFNAALAEALDKNADGEVRIWASPGSGAGGELKPVKTFERNGLNCRRLSIANKAKGRSASSEYNFCKQKTGKWTLAN